MKALDQGHTVGDQPPLSAWAIHSAALLFPGHLRSCFLALTLPRFRSHTCPIHMHAALPRLSGHHFLPVGLCQAGLPSFTASLRWSTRPLPHALRGFHLYYGNSSSLHGWSHSHWPVPPYGQAEHRLPQRGECRQPVFLHRPSVLEITVYTGFCCGLLSITSRTQ